MKQEVKDCLTTKNVPWEEVGACFMACFEGVLGSPFFLHLLLLQVSDLTQGCLGR
jgi:hypothetical protein